MTLIARGGRQIWSNAKAGLNARAIKTRKWRYSDM